MLFPTHKTKDLNETPLEIPTDFSGRLNLIFIAYQQWQQNEVNSWLALADQLEERHPELRYYEIPVVGEMNWFGQKQLGFWMRTGIRDFKTRARTLTLYIDKDEFRRDLDIPTEQTIAVLLLDDQANVIWRTMGPYIFETAEALFDFVDQYLEKELAT